MHTTGYLFTHLKNTACVADKCRLWVGSLSSTSILWVCSIYALRPFRIRPPILFFLYDSMYFTKKVDTHGFRAVSVNKPVLSVSFGCWTYRYSHELKSQQLIHIRFSLPFDFRMFFPVDDEKGEGVRFFSFVCVIFVHACATPWSSPFDRECGSGGVTEDVMNFALHSSE